MFQTVAFPGIFLYVFAMGYRNQLRQELKRRQEINSRFSLRSFARTLELSPAFLSKVLNGKKGLSLDNALKIAARLQYSPNEVTQFCRLVEIDQKSEKIKSVLLSDGNDHREDEATLLQLDAFYLISDWYHFAIRELVGTRGFKPESVWISKRLGITVQEAREGFARLCRLGLIESKRGVYYKTNSFIATPTDQPSRALRHHHTQMIEKARRAIDGQAVEKRDITGITLPISEDKIRVAKDEIKKFRRKMMRLLNSPKSTSVYQLNVQFFELTQGDGK